MARSEESPPDAELHFEGDSLEVLSSFPDGVKRSLGFSLRQLQIGREPTSQIRSMTSIGPGIFELKEADERVVQGNLPFQDRKHHLRPALF